MEIKKNVSLKPYNTFGVKQSAQYVAIIESTSDVLDALAFDPHPFVLGSGSNILFTQDLDGLVIKNEMKGIELLSENDSHVLLKIAGGENWHQTVRYAVHHGWSGIENLSLIPGTVGAAPVQNIGAYGVEIKDVLVAVETVNLSNGTMELFEKNDCLFGYRDSIFKQEKNKGKYFISHVILQLSKSFTPNTAYGEIEKNLQEKNISNPTLMDLHETIISIRSHKLPDPALIGNAGSFFKNPVINQSTFDQLLKIKPQALHYKIGADHYKIPAGWLIDQAGWKGKRIGNVGCYEKQALVIVNHGDATGGEVWQFAQMVQKDVLEKFGITLEVEINII